MTEDESVNADYALEVGVKILQNMIGINVEQYTLKKKEQVISLSNNNDVIIKEDFINIDLQLSLFPP